MAKRQRSNSFEEDEDSLYRENSHSGTIQTTGTEQLASPWPIAIRRLNNIFQQLTPFCAFCDARLATSITFQRMKEAVPELKVEDLAAMKTILPDFINYAYVSSTSSDIFNIEVQFGKQINQIVNRAKKTCASSSRGNKNLSRNEGRLPPLAKPEVILKVIQQNNSRFTHALGSFTKMAIDQGKDPEIVLGEKMKQYLLPNQVPPLEPHEVTSTLCPDTKSIPLDENERPSITMVLEELKQQPFFHKDIYQTTISAKVAQYGTLDSPLPGIISKVLEEKGIQQMYSHQTAAINGLRKGNNLIISTPTSSGKSLIYQIAILDFLQHNPSTCALFIFPTKALAQDQQRSLNDWISSMPCLDTNIKVSTYDGDTPMEQRATIRSTSNVILTNPDMLHFSILPNATKYWQRFFRCLKLVVIDEIHVYHGTFGTNMAFIMRRLARLAVHFFGSNDVQFISCSATIQNPGMHMKQLVGVSDVLSIDDDGAPSAIKKMMIWNPPLVAHPKILRNSVISESAKILEFFISRNVRTIVFCKTRKTCELIMKRMRENLGRTQRETLLSKIHTYRGGYLPNTRRRIEQQMFRGELLAIIATNALELGIDIGSLGNTVSDKETSFIKKDYHILVTDAVLMVGFPWSLPTFWQQSGRAGRRNRESLTMVIADQNPMDQYYMKNPQYLFEKHLPPLSLELEKCFSLELHIQCAAHELPINLLQDEKYFGPDLLPICEEKLLFLPDKNIYRPRPSYFENPWQYVDIRGMLEEETYAVVDVTRKKNIFILEEIESSRVPFEVYEGAIFIHQGQTYLVEDCNVEQRYAAVHMARVDWTTRQRDYTNVSALETKKKKLIFSKPSMQVSVGLVKKETVVFGYHKLDSMHRITDSIDICMNPITSIGLGLWVDLPPLAMLKLEERQIEIMASIHAFGHLMLNIMPQVMNSFSREIKTECKSPYATRQQPNRVMLYESVPCGVLYRVYNKFESLLQACLQQVNLCDCLDGCPECVYISTCSEQNMICSKPGAQIVVSCLLDMT